MTFVETFIATLAGALAGALVGAIAAWVFSRDLAKRERQHRYRDLMNSLTARIIETLRELADELVQTRHRPPFTRLGEQPPPPRVTARARALAAIEAATAHAQGRDYEVFLALSHALRRIGQSEHPSQAITGLIDSLHAIRYFTPDDYSTLLQAINDFPYVDGQRAST